MASRKVFSKQRDHELNDKFSFFGEEELKDENERVSMDEESKKESSSRQELGSCHSEVEIVS